MSSHAASMDREIRANVQLSLERLRTSSLRDVKCDILHDIRENIDLYRQVLLDSNFSSIFLVLRRDRDDAEVALFALEIFLAVLKPHGSLPGVVSIQAEAAARVFLDADRDSKIFSILLEYLPVDAPTSEFKQDLGIFTLQIVEVLTASQPQALAEACLRCVSGSTALINLLDSRIEGVRHQVLWIITKLSAANMQFRVVLAVQVRRITILNSICSMLNWERGCLQDILVKLAGIMSHALSHEMNMDDREGSFADIPPSTVAALAVLQDCVQTIDNIIEAEAALKTLLQDVHIFELFARVVCVYLQSRHWKVLPSQTDGLQQSVALILKLLRSTLHAHVIADMPNNSPMDALSTYHASVLRDQNVRDARAILGSAPLLLESLLLLAWYPTDAVGLAARCDALAIVTCVCLNALDVQLAIQQCLVPCCPLIASPQDAWPSLQLLRNELQPHDVLTSRHLSVSYVISVAFEHAVFCMNTSLQRCSAAFVASVLFGAQSMGSRLTFLAHGHAPPSVALPWHLQAERPRYDLDVLASTHLHHHTSEFVVPLPPVVLVWTAISRGFDMCSRFLAEKSEDLELAEAASWVMYCTTHVMTVALTSAPAAMRSTKRKAGIVASPSRASLDTSAQELAATTSFMKLNCRAPDSIGAGEAILPQLWNLFINLWSGIEWNKPILAVVASSVLRTFHFLTRLCPSVAASLHNATSTAMLQRFSDMCLSSSDSDMQIVGIEGVALVSAIDRDDSVAAAAVNAVLAMQGSHVMSLAMDGCADVLKLASLPFSMSVMDRSLGLILQQTLIQAAHQASVHLQPSAEIDPAHILTLETAVALRDSTILSQSNQLAALQLDKQRLEAEIADLMESGEERNGITETLLAKATHLEAVPQAGHVHLEAAVAVQYADEWKASFPHMSDQIDAALSLKEQQLCEALRSVAAQSEALSTAHSSLQEALGQISSLRADLERAELCFGNLQDEHNDLLVLLAVKDQHIELLTKAVDSCGGAQYISRITAQVQAAMAAAGEAACSPVAGSEVSNRDAPEVTRSLFQSELRDGTEVWQYSSENISEVVNQPEVEPSPPATSGHSVRLGEAKPRADAASLSDASVALSPLFAEDGRKVLPGNQETFIDVELTPLSPQDSERRSDRGFSSAMGLQDVVQDFASNPYSGFLTRLAPALSQVTQVSAAAAKQLQASAASLRSHLIEGQPSNYANSEQQADLNVSDTTEAQHQPDRGLFSSLFNSMASSILAGQQEDGRSPVHATREDRSGDGYISSPETDWRTAPGIAGTPIQPPIQPPPAALAWSLSAHQQAFEHQMQHDHYNHATAFHLTQERMDSAPESMPQFVAPSQIAPPTTIGWVAASGTSKPDASCPQHYAHEDASVESWPDPFGHTQHGAPVDVGAGSLPAQADSFFNSAKNDVHAGLDSSITTYNQPVQADTFFSSVKHDAQSDLGHHTAVHAAVFSSPNTMKSWF